MDELISKEALLRLIETMPSSPTTERENRLINAFITTVKNFPAADVRPVVLGKWVFCGGTWEGANIFKCSECGKSVYHEETNYCPNCGAMMEES